MSLLKPSPITGSYWADARGPVGFLGGVSSLIMDDLAAVRKELHRAVADTRNAACIFAALPVLAYTGEEGLVVSRAYTAAQEAERRLAPLLDDRFKMHLPYWRDHVTSRDERCWNCEFNSPRANFQIDPNCERCLGTGAIHYEGAPNDAAPEIRAVRVAFATSKLIRKVVTNRNTQQVGDELNKLLDTGVVEAQAAGLTNQTLEKLELAWRFFVVAKRMPKDDEEELFLAFQAAWDAGNYEFAEQMVQINEAA